MYTYFVFLNAVFLKTCINFGRCGAICFALCTTSGCPIRLLDVLVTSLTSHIHRLTQLRVVCGLVLSVTAQSGLLVICKQAEVHLAKDGKIGN